MLHELDSLLGRDLSGPRVRLIGSSLGGFLASLFAAEHPTLVDRMVLIAPAFDFGQRWRERLGETGIERWLAEDAYPFPSADGSHVAVHSQFLLEACELPQRPVVEMPTLVLHGELDYRVPYTQGIGTFTALQRRNIPSQLLVFPDENHWVLKGRNSVQWHRTVFDWLRRYTGPGDTAAAPAPTNGGE